MSPCRGALCPIEQQTLADMVTSRMRQAIVEGKLWPGLRLKEPKLAESLGVSRSPVREAIIRLKSEGLVSGVSHNRVWSPKYRDIEEILSLRTAYECLAAEWVVQRNKLSDPDYDYLQSQIDLLREATKHPDSLSSISLSAADEDFHGYIFRKSGHARLNKLWKCNTVRYRILMHCCIRSHNRIAFASRMISGHQFILDKFKSRDLTAIKDRHRSVNDRRAQQIKETLVKSCSSEKLNRHNIGFV